MNVESSWEALEPNSDNLSADTLMMIPVLLKEAALDSPSFRASANHMNKQFESMESWMTTLTNHMQKFRQELDSLLTSAVAVQNLFMPSFVTKGIVDQDYSILAMRRFAETWGQLWEIVNKTSASRSAHISKSLSQFLSSHMTSYKQTWKTFTIAQSSYDHQLQKFMSLSKSKKPVTIKAEAQELVKLRNAYIKASLDVAYVISQVQNIANHEMIDVFCNSALLQSGLGLTDPVLRPLLVDMYRLKCFSSIALKSLSTFEEKMIHVRNDLESQAIKKNVVSETLDDYRKENSVLNSFSFDASASSTTQKYGWLFLKSSAKQNKSIWVRRWVFVKNGLFGWMMLAPSKDFVQETDKIDVTSCHVGPVSGEDRRHCFSVSSKLFKIVMQAENMAELKSWLQVFESAKRQNVQNKFDNNSQQVIYPQIPDLASSAGTSVDNEFTHSASSKSSTSTGKTSIDTTNSNEGPLSSQKILGKNNSDINEVLGIIDTCKRPSVPLMDGFSSLRPGASFLAPSLGINTPISTLKSIESLVSNVFVNVEDVPSAATANYWGSMNWSLQNSTLETKKSPVKSGSYPETYSALLKAQDTEMRAIFQSMPELEPDEKVVYAFRALIRVNQVKQDVPCRVFCTPKAIYFYATAFAAVTLRRQQWTEFISVERTSGMMFDTVDFIIAGRQTPITCLIFVDPSSVIQQACDFLIANSYADFPLGLEAILEKFGEFRDTRMELLRQHREEIKSKPSFDLPIIRSPDDEGSDIFVGDNEDPASDTVDFLLRRALIAESKDLEEPLKRESVERFDISFTMDKSIAKYSYNIPAKALFHVLFGSKSKAFMFNHFGMFKRNDVHLTPWTISGSGKLERQMSFTLESTGVMGGIREPTQRITSLQRIEKRQDNALYVVYERRSPGILPKEFSFYITSRYIIQAVNESSCKLFFYASIEWLKTSPVGTQVIEKVIYHHITMEAEQVDRAIASCRTELGNRGAAITAIRLFGKLNVVERKDNMTGTAAGDPVYKEIRATKLGVCLQVAGIIIGFILAPIASILQRGRKAGGEFFKAIWSNKSILLALVLSILLNLFLASRWTISLWAVRHAGKVVAPKEGANVMKRAIYLSDINDMIQTGYHISNTPQSFCYSKFRELAEYRPLEDYDLNSASKSVIGSFDQEDSANIRGRIHKTRMDNSLARNELIVQLRVLNHLESEFIIKEYRNWLAQEIEKCGSLAQKVTIAGSLAHVSPDIIHNVQRYCNSCQDEWNKSHLVDY